MSASKKTTEQLVRKCFCEGCGEYNSIPNSTTIKADNCPICCGVYRWQDAARAARRFVKAENIQKAHEQHEKFLHWCRKHPIIDEKGVKLPKHFGQLRKGARKNECK